MLVLSLTSCLLQVSVAGEAVSLKRKSSTQRSGQCLTGQRQPRRPPALHLPQAGVPQVHKAVQLPAPGGQDGKPVYPLPGDQGDDEVGTNRLPYLHQVSKTSPLWLGFRQPGDQPDIWLAPFSLTAPGRICDARLGPAGLGLAQQLALGLAYSTLLFTERINECYRCDSIHNLVLMVKRQFCAALSRILRPEMNNCPLDSDRSHAS